MKEETKFTVTLLRRFTEKNCLNLILLSVLVLALMSDVVGGYRQVGVSHRRNAYNTLLRRRNYYADNTVPHNRFLHSKGLRVSAPRNTRNTIHRGPNTCGISCCAGWKQASNGYCTVPICLPPCLHHGLCIKPDKCKCQVAYTGRTCKYKKHRRVLSSNAILRNKRNRKMRASVIQSIYTRTVSSTRPIRIMRRRYCVPGVCLHGGRCLNGKCRCSRRYTGSHCQLRVYQPSASGQLHLHTSSRSQRAYPAGVCKVMCSHGTCQLTEGNKAICVCHRHYRGTFCTIQSPYSVSIPVRRPRPSAGSAAAAAAVKSGLTTSMGRLEKCYREFFGDKCALAFGGLLTAEACCNGLGQAWGPSCTSCSKITGRSPPDICSKGAPKCAHGRCISLFNSYRCQCNLGYRLGESGTVCLLGTNVNKTLSPFGAALPTRAQSQSESPSGVIGKCFTTLDANGRCSGTTSIHASRAACCCSVGIAWGSDCQPCPSAGTDERNTLCPYGSAYQKVPSKKQSLPVAVAQQATTSHQTEEPILSKAVFTHKNSETSTASAVETTDESGVTSNYAKVATTADILETNGPLNKDISSESTSELAVQTPTVSRQELSDHLRVLTTTEVSTFQHTDLQRLPGTDQAAESPLSNSHALGRERLEITSARKTDEADTSTRTPAVTEKDRNYLKNEENAEGSTTSNVIEAVSALLENHAHANSAISKHASETVIHGAESTTETSTSTPNPAKDWLSYSATTSQTSTLDVERPDVQVLTNNNDGNSRWRAESAYVRKPVYARVDRLPSIFRSGGQSLSDGVSSSQQTRIPVAEPVATSRKTPVSTHEVPTPEPLPRYDEIEMYEYSEEQNICDPSPCINGGTCVVVSPDVFSCECLPGHRGELCEKVDWCSSDPCENGGTCEFTATSYRCLCRQGFVGNMCETDFDECASNPCVHGTCRDSVDGYACMCNAGYTGVTCSADINECDAIDNLCGDKAVCINTPGSYRCSVPRSCGPGYTTSDFGTTCIDINECKDNATKCSGGTCQNTDGSYYCSCMLGYRSAASGSSCEDIDECQTVECGGTSKCHNYPGSYRCECFLDDEYYDATRQRCVSSTSQQETDSAALLPEPETDPSRQTCYANYMPCNVELVQNVTERECCCTFGRAWGQCTQCPFAGSASFELLCPHGHGKLPATNSFSASDIDECDLFGHEVACPNGRCVNSYGSFQCICFRGFYYNRRVHACEDFDECVLPHKCVGGTCVNAIGSFHCKCPTGYLPRFTGMGLTCTPTHRPTTTTTAVLPVTVGPGLYQQPRRFSPSTDPCYDRLTTSMCSGQPDRNATYKDCCCFGGKVWGASCSMCPSSGSADLQFLCEESLPPSQSVDVIQGRGRECGIEGGCANGLCVRVRNGYTCKCNSGFRLNPHTMKCEDINECFEHIAVYQLCINGRCVNTQGSFYCHCIRGFRPSQNNPTLCIPAFPDNDYVNDRPGL